MPIADVAWAIEDVRARAQGLALVRDYDEGRHRLLFASDKFRNTFGRLFQEFADNLCDDVVDAITDRLQITAWSSNDKSLTALAQKAWAQNQGEARSGAVFRHGFRDGDGYEIVQETEKGVRWYKQDPRLMAVRYSTEYPDELAVAAKVWKDKANKRWRVNLYYWDHVEKYASKGTSNDGGLPNARAFTILRAGDPGLHLEEDSGMTALPWGMPVYHYPNGELSTYGRSILAGVIPLQDALNKSIADMLVNMEHTAHPQRWASGITTKVDPLTGEEENPFREGGPGSVWWTGKPEARFGQFTAGEQEQFLKVQASFRAEAARKGAMPPYMVSMDMSSLPSGVSLLVAEGRTIKLARDRARDWGAEQKRKMAMDLTLRLGRQVDPEELDLEWAPPETRDERALIETLALKKDLGVPTEQLLIEAGYDQEEVTKWLAAAEDKAEEQRILAQVLSGGRPSVTPNQARALPAGPQPPAGGQTALAS